MCWYMCAVWLCVCACVCVVYTYCVTIHHYVLIHVLCDCVCVCVHVCVFCVYLLCNNTSLCVDTCVLCDCMCVGGLCACVMYTYCVWRMVWSVCTMVCVCIVERNAWSVCYIKFDYNISLINKNINYKKATQFTITLKMYRHMYAQSNCFNCLNVI